MTPFLLVLAALVGAAFFTPLLFLVWIRNRERYRRERLPPLLKAFLSGAVLGVIMAGLLATMVAYVIPPATVGAFQEAFPFLTAGAFLAVVVAPLAEEPAKAVWLLTFRGELQEPEDGLVYGAAIGLGFGATENVLYALVTLLFGGVELAVATVVFRTLGTVLLHGAATALVGYGATRSLRWGAHVHLPGLVPALGVAVLLHGAFNVLASVDDFAVNLAGVLAAALLFLAVAARVRALDRRGPHA
ncbi:MAG TPA: PrsW family glutamic-type intramembrane protease [Candidatus Thermoplasmatota archaeon]|nr:PrsW family glutamic-type intramembrane protease [Candidatus Thermoplasmatota archaeon]